jgi:hypothetical protein
MERVLATYENDGPTNKPVLVGNDFVVEGAAPAIQRERTQGSFPWGVERLYRGDEV